MINVQNYLKEQFKNPESTDNTYAIVEYIEHGNPKKVLVYFCNYHIDGDWFLEAPCCISFQETFSCTPDEFCKSFLHDAFELEDGVDEDDYIEKFMKPLIRNNTYYEIDCPQTGPFLPKEVDKITLINESEALDYLLKLKEDL